MSGRNHRWKALPNMRESKCSFNPCLFNGCVYLCGFGSKLVEAFSPRTDRFLPLQVQVPENTVCCLLVHSNLLVVHSENHVSKFAAGLAGQLVQHSQVHSQASVDKYSNSQPVVDLTRSIFFIYQGGKVLGIDLETGVEAQRFT